MVAQYCNKVQARKTRHSTEMVICEDNEAVVKICARGRSKSLNHFPRTHKIAVGWVYEFCKLSHVKLANVTSEAQTADIFIKAVAKSDVWKALLDLCQIRPHPELSRPEFSMGKANTKKASMQGEG